MLQQILQENLIGLLTLKYDWGNFIMTNFIPYFTVHTNKQVHPPPPILFPEHIEK